MIKNFTDLDAWKEAHKLTLIVYKVTKNFPKEETFGLTSQIRRAAVSVESCIAEGFARFHYKDRTQFYIESRGSIAEIESQAITSRDLEYLSSEDFNNIFGQAEKTAIILGGLIRSTRKLSTI